MKLGVKDFFSVYLGLALTTASVIAFMYDWREGVQISRYKSSYTILRPNDPILKMYPRHYITDNQLLPADHPTKLEDCDDLPKGRSIYRHSIHRSAKMLLKLYIFSKAHLLIYLTYLSLSLFRRSKTGKPVILNRTFRQFSYMVK